MSLKQHLDKRRNAGLIDFIEVPLDWGHRNKEFVGFSHEHKIFFRIFFDNKYREDNFTPKIDVLRERLNQLKMDSSGTGLFSNRDEIKSVEKEIIFYEKYLYL